MVGAEQPALPLLELCEPENSKRAASQPSKPAMQRGALVMCCAPSAGAMERFVEEKAGRRVRVAALDCPSVPSLLLLPGSRVGGAWRRGHGTPACHCLHLAGTWPG